MTWILRLFSLLLGYSFGNISGKTVVKAMDKDEKYAIVIDVLKTVIVLAFIRWSTSLTLKNVGVMIGAIGVVLGHLYPYWTKTKETNAIVVIMAAWIMISFFWGVTGILIGAFVVFVAHYLPLGQLTVPIIGFLATFFTEGMESKIYALILLAIAIVGLRNDLTKIRTGKYPKFELNLPRKKSQLLSMPNILSCGRSFEISLSD